MTLAFLIENLSPKITYKLMTVGCLPEWTALTLSDQFGVSMGLTTHTILPNETYSVRGRAFRLFHFRR